jgi:imidazolonepropionase-like amidohydrolase
VADALIRVTGRALPDGDLVRLVAIDGHWASDTPTGGGVDVSGWILPGLVDVHTHPGAHEPGDEFDEELLRTEMNLAIDQGVLAVRSPGLAGDPPDWFGNDPDLPAAAHAGPWMARPGHFFDGWGLRVSDEDFPRVAAEQARTGWCKVIGDWGPDDEPVPQMVMTAIVEAVHEVGGHVAVHTQHAAGSRAAIKAGVDSLEHGVRLERALLDEMRLRGTVLVPTLRVFQDVLATLETAPPTPRRDWSIEGASGHAGLVGAAHDAGVRILAGTDSHEISIVDEVKALAAAGMSNMTAIGAASWDARDFLGLSSLEPGAPADATIYDTDPSTNLDALAHPHWVIRKGRLLRPSGQ